MAQMTFYLHRVRLMRPVQRLLMEDSLTSSQMLLRILEERPTIEIRKGYFWHIGNVTRNDPHSGRFAAGRTTKAIIEKYDDATRDFQIETLEASPYTWVVFDSEIGILGIAKKTKLTRSVAGIAKNIQRVFQRTQVVEQNGIDVQIDPIRDPTGFIDSIQSAYAVSRFTVTFSLPNPIDTEEMFHKPMQCYLRAARGEKGKTSIKGKDLDPDTLVLMARSVAASGDDATASVLESYGSKAVTKHLEGDGASFIAEEEIFTLPEAVAELRRLYHEIRGSSNALE